VTSGDFEVTWTSATRRSLNRLPEKVATAVVELAYGSLAANPRRISKPLKLNLEGLHSARRGDYRVIYRIHTDQHRVDVIAVEHRADAYRRPLTAATQADRSHRHRTGRPGGKDSAVPWSPRSRRALPVGSTSRPSAASA